MAPRVAAAQSTSQSAPQLALRAKLQKTKRIYYAVEARDMAALEELAFSAGGFFSTELRRSAWSCLLGIAPEQASDNSWRKLITAQGHCEEKDQRVMKADVNRSVYTWDVHTSLKKSKRSQKRQELSDVMHAVLQRHGEKFAYFQGFHDIALVFCEIGSPTQAFHMVERLALFHLSDQFCWSLDEGLLPILSTLFVLVELLDVSVAEALRESNCEELHFAISWVLTWFSHSLPRLHQQVMRLFDCLLASHPAMILYFSASLIISHREAILRVEPREMCEMISALQRIPLATLDVDNWAADAQHLAAKLPPEELIARLPSELRRRLPRTSPLLNQFHPWIRSDQNFAGPHAIAALAPIYSGRVAGTAHMRSPVESRRFVFQFALLWWPSFQKGWSRSALRAIGFAGMVSLVVLLWALVWGRR